MHVPNSYTLVHFTPPKWMDKQVQSPILYLNLTLWPYCYLAVESFFYAAERQKCTKIIYLYNNRFYQLLILVISIYSPFINRNYKIINKKYSILKITALNFFQSPIYSSLPNKLIMFTFPLRFHSNPKLQALPIAFKDIAIKIK